MKLQDNSENQKKVVKELEKVATEQFKLLVLNKKQPQDLEENNQRFEELNICIEKYGIDAEFVRHCVKKIQKYKLLNACSLGLVKKFNHKKDQYRKRIADKLKDSYDVVIDLSDVDNLVFPVFDKPKVSIIIPCYNGFDITMKCLRSVLAHTQDIPYEVIIADDKSTDEIKNIAPVKPVVQEPATSSKPVSESKHETEIIKQTPDRHETTVHEQIAASQETVAEAIREPRKDYHRKLNSHEAAIADTVVRYVRNMPSEKQNEYGSSIQSTSEEFAKANNIPTPPPIQTAAVKARRKSRLVNISNTAEQSNEAELARLREVKR